MTVKISPGNSKLGSIPSVSLPSGMTCVSDCECNTKCYARRLERLRPAVKSAYEHNYKVLCEDPETYWREVEASIMMSRFFRFHVSGDIPNIEYIEKMVEVAKRNRHCDILCFTKKYEIVNRYISNTYFNSITGTSIRPQLFNMQMIAEEIVPSNLHIILSVWRNFPIQNPYSFPEAHVRYRDGTTTAADNAQECSGNCSECAVTDSGCWTLKLGEQVVFNEH